MKELAVCSDGQVFKNINKTHKITQTEKRLHRLQRKASRKYEMNKREAVRQNEQPYKNRKENTTPTQTVNKYS